MCVTHKHAAFLSYAVLCRPSFSPKIDDLINTTPPHNRTDDSHTCNCETCCESRPFTTCTKALTYGVGALSPAAGLVSGGQHVLVKATTDFVKFGDPKGMACRFGDDGDANFTVVPATLLSSTALACVAPPAAAASVVPLEVTLDGGAQWTQSKQTFAYCPAGDAACLRAHAACPHGWKGPVCDVECRGGAADPCAGQGFCLDDPPGACVCQAGYAGKGCEHADPAAVAMTAAAATSDADDRTSHDSSSSLLGQGFALGLGVAALVLVAVAAFLYARRDAVGEQLFWRLAAGRFDRLVHRGGSEEEGAMASSAAEARSAGVELVRSAPPPLLPRYKDDLDMTVLE